MLKTLIDLIYPLRCPLCGDIVIPKGEKICYECRPKLPYVKEPSCMKCSKPIEDEDMEFCGDCQRKSFSFTRGYSLWVYDERMRQSISAFKYLGRKEYGAFYVEEILKNLKGTLDRLELDGVVAVPLHPRKLRKRGYNQAKVIAKPIAKACNLPYIDLLLRSKNTLPQKELSDKERIKNLQSAFAINKRVLNGLSVPMNRLLLVDDIYTTGSTIEACTELLLQYGVKEVYFLTLCIGKGFA